MLKTNLKDLINHEVNPHPKGGRVNQTKISDFCAIICSGGVTLLEFHKVRDVLLDIVPEFFRDGIDPFWVAAVGSATLAKEFSLDPPLTSNYIDYQMIDGVDYRLYYPHLDDR